MVEQIRGVLGLVYDLDRPDVALKVRLLDLLTPKPADTCLKLLFGCDRRPSQLMETMLAIPGEEDSILFKMLYVTKLPSNVRSHVLAWISLSSREMTSLADNLWFDLNQRHLGAKSNHVAAAVPDDIDELEEALAELNVQPK